ncbi:hypothetical protein GYMLUDRAFT_571200 [Collybiopsis luxurians FD-317 M1]|uniref:Uncharacterized protein n=1 Tax=Collybiopsis luxurians FD-317 M1 TaxID=944289 RepID=A0A0D0C0E6_9AGAR|nr:hypothetical protein GYMLUDRAFT_571200 [Collybiopsis luxurians FD-317 M1]
MPPLYIRLYYTSVSPSFELLYLRIPSGAVYIISYLECLCFTLFLLQTHLVTLILDSDSRQVSHQYLFSRLKFYPIIYLSSLSLRSPLVTPVMLIFGLCPFSS